MPVSETSTVYTDVSDDVIDSDDITLTPDLVLQDSDDWTAEGIQNLHCVTDVSEKVIEDHDIVILTPNSDSDNWTVQVEFVLHCVNVSYKVEVAHITWILLTNSK